MLLYYRSETLKLGSPDEVARPLRLCTTVMPYHLSFQALPEAFDSHKERDSFADPSGDLAHARIPAEDDPVLAHAVGYKPP